MVVIGIEQGGPLNETLEIEELIEKTGTGQDNDFTEVLQQTSSSHATSPKSSSQVGETPPIRPTRSMPHATSALGLTGLGPRRT